MITFISCAGSQTFLCLIKSSETCCEEHLYSWNLCANSRVCSTLETYGLAISVCYNEGDLSHDMKKAGSVCCGKQNL